MSTLTRTEFEIACKAYIAKYPTESSHLLAKTYSHGWSWKEHASLPHFGYMSRRILLPLDHIEPDDDDDDPLVDEQLDPADDGALSACVPNVLTSEQSVVFSSTYQVPAFYFTLHHNNGAPLSLAEIMRTPMFRPNALSDREATSFALTDPGSSFALLSQGDHPILGTPSWYLHPCHTHEMVGEVMIEVQKGDWTTEQRLVRWMEAWFMVLGNVVDCTAGSCL
ncbi:hypothetical protein B0H21DRAFT_739613, partial [Amylocystis lapponica]